MGHLPSKEVSAKPFFVDLHTAKGAVDRLVAVSVTKDNFPSVDHPLFKQFVDLRCHPSVLHWLDPKEDGEEDRLVLPVAPTAEALYHDYVIAGTDLVEEMSAHHPISAYQPIPIALFRFTEASSVAEDAESPYLETEGVIPGSRLYLPDTTLLQLAATEDIRMVGYLNVNATFPCPTFGVNTGSGQMSLFLDKSLWNEAKSTTIVQVASKCYEHFSKMLGITPKPQWPLKLVDRCHDTNLPKLRQNQVIYRLFQPAGVDMVHAAACVTLTANSDVTAALCTALAASVAPEMVMAPTTTTAFGEQQVQRTANNKFHLVSHRDSRHQPTTAEPALVTTTTTTSSVVPPLIPLPFTPTPLDDIIGVAKEKWAESNAVVVAAKKWSPATATNRQRRVKSKSKLAVQVRQAQLLLAGLDGSGTTGASATLSLATPIKTTTPNSQISSVGCSLNEDSQSGGLTTQGAGNSLSNASSTAEEITAVNLPAYAHPTTTGDDHPIVARAGLPFLGGAPTTISTTSPALGPRRVAALVPHSSAPPPQYSHHCSALPSTAQHKLPGGIVQVVKIPFQCEVELLLPMEQSTFANQTGRGKPPAVMQTLPVKWVDSDLELILSPQRNPQQPGILLELARHPASGTIKVIGPQGVMVALAIPQPCFVNLPLGTPVFLKF